MCGLLGGAASVLLAKKAAADVRRGWVMTRVLAAAHDLPEGAVLAPGLLLEREAIEQRITDSAVRPADLTRVLGVPLGARLNAGDTLNWSMVFQADAQSQKACDEAVAAAKAEGRVLPEPVAP